MVHGIHVIITKTTIDQLINGIHWYSFIENKKIYNKLNCYKLLINKYSCNNLLYILAVLYNFKVSF